MIKHRLFNAFLVGNYLRRTRTSLSRIRENYNLDKSSNYSLEE